MPRCTLTKSRRPKSRFVGSMMYKILRVNNTQLKQLLKVLVPPNGNWEYVNGDSLFGNTGLLKKTPHRQCAAETHQHCPAH